MSMSRFCPTCGAANSIVTIRCFSCHQLLDQLAEEVASASLLHQRYRLLMSFGSGGYGTVYKAFDTQAGNKPVAIKQVNLQGLSVEQIIEATDTFNREAQMLSSCRHPQLPHIYDQFSDAEHWYLVMDFLEGETLESYAEHNAPLSVEEVLDIGLQLCTVLTYLHTRQPPIIFRDLKPSNIMRTQAGKLYLFDFGIARRFKPGQAKDTMPLGSPGYAAPEQYGKAQTTPQADVYSLGALLHFLLSGNDPSEQSFHFEPLRLYGEGIRELDTLFQQMVMLDASQRPQNIQHVADELERIKQEQNHTKQAIIRTPLQAPTAPSSPHISPTSWQQGQQQQSSQQASGQAASSRSAHPSRRRFIGGGLVAAGMLTIGWWLVAHTPHTPHTPSHPPMPGSFASYWSSDMQYIALQEKSNGKAPNNDLQIRDAHLQVIQTIHLDTADTRFDAHWSPDKTRLLTVQTLNSYLSIWSIKDGKRVTTYPRPIKGMSMNTWDLAWSPDGKRIAFSAGLTLQVLSAIDGQSLFVKDFSHDASMGSSDALVLTWSPDSTSLALSGNAVTQNDTKATITIWDVMAHRSTNQITVPLPPGFTAPVPIQLAWSPTNQQQIALSFSDGLIGNNTTQIINPSNTNDVSTLGTFDTLGSVDQLGWSPNGNLLAALRTSSILVYSSSSSSIAAWDVATGRQSYLANSSGNPIDVSAFGWSADSSNIISADKKAALTTWTLEQ